MTPEAPDSPESRHTSADAPEPSRGMTFLDHLEELRRTLIHILIAVGAGAVACWWLSGPTLDWLIAETAQEAIFMKPQGAFLARLKVAVILGLLLTLPFVFYKVWNFVGPGLLETERKFVLPGSLMSVVLFYTGLAFSYFVLTPLMVKVLLGFATSTLTANTEISFLLELVFKMGLACGFVFQLPLILAFLTLIGIIDHRFLRKYWRHAVVLIFILAALLTPADPFSQIVLALPLLALYGLSMLISWLIVRSRSQHAKEES